MMSNSNNNKQLKINQKTQNSLQRTHFINKDKLMQFLLTKCRNVMQGQLQE